MLEAAALANRTPSTISLWARLGHLPHTRPLIDGRRVLLFRPEDVARVSAEKDRTCEKRNYRKPRESEEETMEDVERMIAEQMKPENLPDWFHKDWERMKGKNLNDLLKGDE